MPGTAAGVAKARAVRDANKEARRLALLGIDRETDLAVEHSISTSVNDVQQSSTVCGAVEPLPARNQSLALAMANSQCAEMMGVVVRIAKNPRNEARDRLAAARTVLDVAGVVAPTVAAKGINGLGQAPSEMTRSDLDTFIGAGLRALALRQSAASACDVNVIDANVIASKAKPDAIPE